MGKNTGGGDGRARTFMSPIFITQETADTILYVSMRCARVIPGGREYRVMRLKKYPPAKVESTVEATVLCIGSAVAFVL